VVPAVVSILVVDAVPLVTDIGAVVEPEVPVWAGVGLVVASAGLVDASAGLVVASAGLVDASGAAVSDTVAAGEGADVVSATAAGAPALYCVVYVSAGFVAS
jgi:hypothetical protein